MEKRIFEALTNINVSKDEICIAVKEAVKTGDSNWLPFVAMALRRVDELGCMNLAIKKLGPNFS